MPYTARWGLSAGCVSRFSRRERSPRTKKGEDFVTPGDKRAQRLIVRLLKERFPRCGIVAEEDGLNLPSKNGPVFTSIRSTGRRLTSAEREPA